MPRAPLLSLNALRVIAVTALSFSLLAACGKTPDAAEDAASEAIAETAGEVAADAGIDIEENGQTVSGVDAQGRPFSAAQGKAATIPAEFPPDVFVPEGLALDTSMVVAGSAFIGGTLPGDLADLSARVDAGMTGAGWTSLMAMTDAGSSTLLWQRGDRSVSYLIETRPDGQVGVAISHAVEDEAPAADVER